MITGGHPTKVPQLEGGGGGADFTHKHCRCWFACPL